MRLQTLLEQTGDPSQPFEDRGAVEVFGNGWRYYRLADYVVTRAVSGPSLVLVPRQPSVLNRSRGLSGGGGGIRTHGRRKPTPVFKTGAFDHSATPPRT